MTSLILPAYNPGLVLERTWHAVRAFLRGRTDPWEAIFVLDGCSDDSVDRLESLKETAADSRMKVLHYSPNRGKGYAVRQGLLAAHGEFRIFTDIDLAYSFDDVLRVANSLWQGDRVAIASREHADSMLTLPARYLGYAYRRRIQSGLFRRVAKLLLPIEQPDTQAGLKGMTATVANAILPHLTCNGFGFDCELLTVCQRSKIPVQEIPVSIRYEDTASTTGLGSSLRMLRELGAIRKAWRKRAPLDIPAEPIHAVRIAA